MIKQDIISKVKALNLPENSYIVFGSGSLAILGIREVNDIDLLISKELYKELKKKGWKKVYKGPKDKPLTFDVFEAHYHWDFSHYSPTLQELLSRSMEVEGVIFASLEDIEKWKIATGRPKDIADLKLIADYRNSKG